MSSNYLGMAKKNAYYISRLFSVNPVYFTNICSAKTECDRFFHKKFKNTSCSIENLNFLDVMDNELSRNEFIDKERLANHDVEQQENMGTKTGDKIPEIDLIENINFYSFSNESEMKIFWGENNFILLSNTRNYEDEGTLDAEESVVEEVQLATINNSQSSQGFDHNKSKSSSAVLERQSNTLNKPPVHSVYKESGVVLAIGNQYEKKSFKAMDGIEAPVSSVPKLMDKKRKPKKKGICRNVNRSRKKSETVPSGSNEKPTKKIVSIKRKSNDSNSLFKKSKIGFSKSRTVKENEPSSDCKIAMEDATYKLVQHGVCTDHDYCIKASTSKMNLQNRNSVEEHSTLKEDSKGLNCEPVNDESAETKNLNRNGLGLKF